jgi:hypothetical protein
MSASSKAWYWAHREQALASMKRWRQENPDKKRASALNWSKEHPERVRANMRAYHRRTRLRECGSTEEEADCLLVLQENKCYICRREVKLTIDHNHVTGKFRGLICSRCNTFLGFIKDDWHVFQRGIDYLRAEE